MHLEVIKHSNDNYLYKVNAVRVDKGKYKRIKEFIGKESELKLLYHDPIMHFKKLIKEETDNIKNDLKNEYRTIRIKSNKFDHNAIANNLIYDEKLQLNLGFVFLQFLYHQLEFEALLYKIQQKEKTKIQMSKVLQLLIFCRVLYPNSKLSDFRMKDNFAEIFKISKDDIYRGLVILNKYKDEIISHFCNNAKKFVKFDLTNSHYDLTNYYVYTDNETTLIKNGYSKVRNGKPIIQHALLTDGNGIPVNYQLFSGNRTDVTTLSDFLITQNKRFNIRNSTIIADAGLVSHENIAAILLSKNQYVFKESLLRVNKEIMSTFENVVKPKLEEVMQSNPNLKGCFFSVTLDVDLRLESPKGRIVRATIPQKYIFTYSKKFDAKLERVRLDQLEDAQKYIRDSAKLKNKFKKSLPELVKVDKIKANTEIDENKLEKYEKTSGYSILITSKIDSNDKDIIQMYKKQYLIEECFRICKTDLDLDNIYLRKDDRIEGHFLIGYLALSFLRILQTYTKNEHSVADIQKKLKELMLLKFRRNNLYQVANVSDVISKLEQSFNVDISNDLWDGNDLRKFIGNLKKVRKTSF